jgi:hypothetical protein
MRAQRALAMSIAVYLGGSDVRAYDGASLVARAHAGQCTAGQARPAARRVSDNQSVGRPRRHPAFEPLILQFKGSI